MIYAFFAVMAWLLIGICVAAHTRSNWIGVSPWLAVAFWPAVWWR